jgi:hypothetical protein
MSLLRVSGFKMGRVQVRKEGVRNRQPGDKPPSTNLSSLLSHSLHCLSPLPLKLSTPSLVLGIPVHLYMPNIRSHLDNMCRVSPPQLHGSNQASLFPPSESPLLSILTSKPSLLSRFFDSNLGALPTHTDGHK